MGVASDPDLLVLHSLRLKSLASVATVAELTDLTPEDIEDRLEAFAGKGWTRHRDGGVLSGWSLTPAGRVEGVRRLADELEATGTRPVIEAAYAQFLTRNQPFLQVCTDWQLRPSGPGGRTEVNDHADADYDRKVIARLQAIDAEVRPVCDTLTAALARYWHYAGRFATALRRVEHGETDWFTRPVLDSYHTVWFELHEDLLATLGIERSSQRGPGPEARA
jgi:hypothetical protein